MATILIKSDSRYPINRDKIKQNIEKVLHAHEVTSDVVVSIAVSGTRKMRQINRDFHGEDYATDVLSFPYLDPQSNNDVTGYVVASEAGEILGDILICYPVAVQQASQKNILVDDEIDFLVEHGMLHLLGEHHE